MKQLTKEKIITKTMELFFDNGVEETYIYHILKTCKVSNGTFFYYFESKDKIVLAIYQIIKNESEDYFYDNTMDDMDFKISMLNYWKRNIDWILNHPKEYNFIKTCNRYKIIKDEYKINKSTEACLNKISESIINKETTIADSDLLFKNFIGIRDSFISYVLENDKSSKEIEEISMDMFERFIHFVKV